MDSLTWVSVAAAAYVVCGLVHANREAALCRAENARHGEPAPLWPVWLVVTLLWPMLVAQRAVLAVLVLHDVAAARAADKREGKRG